MHHSSYSKFSARDRVDAPRFYYKRTHSYTVLQRLRLVLRRLLAFLFTQVGVCALIAAYTVLGAFLFAALEADSQMAEARLAADTRAQFLRRLWNVTLDLNVLEEAEWRGHSDSLVADFQAQLVDNVRRGYTGTEPGVRIWTFSSALMYSLTIFTTIGYGNLTPKTDGGKLMTIIYALVGIPLMLLYMTNIGHILGSSFKYAYSKMCRSGQKAPKSLPSKATLPNVLATPANIGSASFGSSDNKPSKTNSTRSKQSSTEVETAEGGGGNRSGSATPKIVSRLKHFQSMKKKGQGGEQQQPQPSLIVWPSVDDDEVECAEGNHVDDGSGAFCNGDIAVVVPDESLTREVAGTDNINTKISSLTPAPATQIRLKPALTLKRQLSFSDRDPSSSDPSPTSNAAHCPAALGVSGSLSASQRVAALAAANKTNTVEFKLVEDLRLVTVPVSSCLLVLVCYIVLGTVLFSAWEGWDYLDGAYFCFVSLMTIGFGDFVPGNDYVYKVSVDDVNYMNARAKMIIGTIYLLLGMAIVAMCLNLMQEKIVEQIRTMARRVGLIRPARYGANR